MAPPPPDSSVASRLVVLGARGDLFSRYLLPAVAELAAHEALALDVVGVARADVAEDEFRDDASADLAEHAPDLAETVRDDVARRVQYVQGDATDRSVLERAAAGADGPVVVHLALPPSVFPEAIASLSEADLPDGSLLVVEKPFGTDLDAARSLNALIQDRFGEERVLRADHFLGMQTVQNVIGLRFANRVVAPLWTADHVESIDIVWDETLALEGRAGFYDDTGALRDMVQSHLLQMLALVAMERPVGLDAPSMQAAKAAALAAVVPPRPDEVPHRTRRARYTSGRSGEGEVPGYADEEGVDPDRGTETFAEVELRIRGDRWREEVPFRLRTGKALASDRHQIVVRFRPTEVLPFAGGEAGRNELRLGIDPDRVELRLNLNGPGDPFELTTEELGLDLPAPPLSAYAQLLRCAAVGDTALSIGAAEAERSWEIVAPVLEAWGAGDPPLETYPAGSDGP